MTEETNSYDTIDISVEQPTPKFDLDKIEQWAKAEKRGAMRDAMLALVARARELEQRTEECDQAVEDRRLALADWKAAESEVGRLREALVAEQRARNIADEGLASMDAALKAARAGPEAFPDECHDSHDVRSSDASSYDVVCKSCGAHDESGAGWGNLRKPCPVSSPTAGLPASAEAVKVLVEALETAKRGIETSATDTIWVDAPPLVSETVCDHIAAALSDPRVIAAQSVEAQHA